MAFRGPTITVIFFRIREDTLETKYNEDQMLPIQYHDYCKSIPTTHEEKNEIRYFGKVGYSLT